MDSNTETTRLYVMNLSFQVTHEEVQQLFGPYGEVLNVEIPLRKGGKGEALGISYVTFKETEGAISAFASLDKTFFQGRKLHIFPSQKKPPKEESQFPENREKFDPKQQEERSEFKKDKEATLKLNFDDETNWNYLFMNQDTVATSMAKRLGLDKS